MGEGSTGIIIMVVILFGGLFLMNYMGKRSQKRRQEEREKMFGDGLEPGVWMQTFSGFFGRYVDTDGDVVILESPSGEETYWLKAAISGQLEPPFEAVQDETIDVDILDVSDSDLPIDPDDLNQDNDR